VVSTARIETTPSIAADARRLLDAHPHDALVVTGYGRTMAEVAFDATTVTEIKAFARGAGALHPGCRTVLDVGGQDTKVIVTDGAGRPLRFEMNDRCAAGAGRFLEMMAQALGYGLDEFGRAALEGGDGLRLSAMCAVFAESEVVGLVTRGVRREDIARAVHRTVADRAGTMIGRVREGGAVAFAGGGARNPCLAALVAEASGAEVLVAPDAQLVGALGAALLAADRAKEGGRRG
jgi:predicted CoA-substrate-specific enzyme activase